MISIPTQLIDCRFIKTLDKHPTEKEWPKINNYNYNDFNIQGTTYGVATGFNRLIVIDCDKQYIQDKLLEIEQIRNTFTVRTATKRLNHFYFKTDIDNPKTFSLNDKNGERILDFQAQGHMVVGPNSILSDGKTYDIVNDCDIAFLPYTFLKNILFNIEPNLKISEKEDRSDMKDVFYDYDDMCTQIKDRISIRDILIKNGINAVAGTNSMCPLGHTSVGGKCFSFTKNVWYCFHCYQSGNVFQLVQKIKKINFIDAKRQLAQQAGLSDETNNKILLNYSDGKHRHIASELLATEFMKLYRVYTIREDKDVEIYIYHEGIYVPEGKTYIKEYVRNILLTLYSEAFTKIVIDKIAVDTFIEKEHFFINENINLIPLQNGILNLMTLELMDFSSEYRFFNKLPVIYDPLITIDKSLAFIKDVVATETDVLTIQEIAGYLLYRENLLEKSFMFLGKGRNGKGKLIELLINLIGDENKTNVSLSSIENDSFSIISLHNKYANFSPDISSEALNHTGKFKSLVGRDVMNADRKFKTPIEFKSYAKMIFAANTLPSTKDMSDGFWDRWVIIDFPYKFVDEPIEKNQKKKDLEIINKIISTKEMSGFLNWAIEGLKRLLKNKRFTYNPETAEIKNKWLSESNTFAKFWFSEIIETDNISDTIYRDDLMVVYDDFCNNYNLEKENDKTIHAFVNQHCLYKRVKAMGDLQYILKKVKFKTYIIPVEEVVEEELKI